MNTEKSKHHRDYDRRLTEQTEALATLGFRPAFSIGATMFSMAQAATCQTCGAMVNTDAVGIHHDWHEDA